MSNKYSCAAGQSHITPNGAKYCDTHVMPRTPAPSATAGASRRVTHVSEPPTYAQRAYVRRLGGTVPEGANRLEVSILIQRLLDTPPTPAPTKEAPPIMQPTTSLGIPPEMIFAIRPGYYAVSPMGGALDFVRLSVVKDRRSMGWSMRQHIGWIKVQTQHSDDLIDRALIGPEGQVKLLSTSANRERLSGMLLSIIVDQRAAAIKYGQEIGHCCRCGKSLTDERSRWYGIGPDCEGEWPDVIAEVDDQRGVYTESSVYQ